MFRRRPAPAAPPPPPWRLRLDASRDLIRRHAADPSIEARLDDLERILTTAVADQEKAGLAVAQLDPDRAARELKDALRRRDHTPGPALEEQISSLQRRYETIHALQDRADELDRRIETTLTDLDSLAARSVTLALTASRSPAAELAEELHRLHTDLTALELAHDELRRL
jgi:DNA repair exonuclease SbcCD ATPase subunit